MRSLGQYQRRYRESLEQPAAFWSEVGERLTWFHPPDTAFVDDLRAADVAWYPNGQLNACFNCVDRHLPERADQAALVWAANEPGVYRRITYRELAREVGKLANALLAHGVRRGDRVCIYMPMIPEAIYAMLACARIGAVHAVVFAGFSAEALRDRILDAGARVVITANEAPRGDKVVPLKAIVDAALEGIPAIDAVLVARRTAADVAMQPGRDLWLDEELARHRSICPAVWMAAEDPLFILYTSGSTGKPKGVLHTTAGYLVYAAFTHDVVFDLQPDDVFFCTADIGWITGHSYLTYGPLANGVTTVVFESTPTFPDAGRLWQVVDDLQVTVLYTAPTLLRTLIQAGNELVQRSSRRSLRVLGSVGEPINPEVWRWYRDVVGERRCPVIDTWWQTETGGILITPLPGVGDDKPGSAALPFFGIEPILVDDQGQTLTGPEVTGNLCLARGWPGRARTVWGDHQRFEDTYFSRFPGTYFTGDGCRRDADGYHWITGRVDDVINVSGHRIGTAEVESALIEYAAVAEAAVVGYPHDRKGTAICAYVTVKEAATSLSHDELVPLLRDQVRRAIGPFAAPDRIRIVDSLPKTRSGKIMRRILRLVAEGRAEQLGDTSTLADPNVVDHIVAQERGGAR